MKIISIILCFIMLGQNVPPCMIGFGCGEVCEASAELPVDIADENEDSESENHCDNNCDCVCCGQISTMYNYAFTGDYSSSNYIALNSNYAFQYSFSFHSGVWHPPSA